MSEIGGYIEFEHNHGLMLHEEMLALNCGRAALAYLIEARSIKTIWLPTYICDSVSKQCDALQVSIKWYFIGSSFEPVWDFTVASDEYLYLVDYYGQLNNEQILHALEVSHGNLIVDEAQNYFCEPRYGIDTLYTCRKFFGVPDGAFLSTDAQVNRELPQSESFEHMRFLLGRFERTASEFFAESQENNHRFVDEPVSRMSLLTENILRGIDYEYVRSKREENYKVLAKALEPNNALVLNMPPAPFAYPLYVENGPTVRKHLAAKGIYISTLWPNVVTNAPIDTVASKYARNILPLPVDQRYGPEEMHVILVALQEEGIAVEA